MDVVVVKAKVSVSFIDTSLWEFNRTGKNMLPFGNIAEYSLVKESEDILPGVSVILRFKKRKHYRVHILFAVRISRKHSASAIRFA